MDDSVIISNPLTVAEPVVGWSKVASIWIKVVLPAPFGPKSPKTSFCSMFKFRLSTAVKFLYFLVRFWIFIKLYHKTRLPYYV